MEEEKVITKPKRGYVINCSRLNVRTEPDMKADVVAIIDAGTRLTYEPTDSDDWYKICTVVGIKGFCKAEFVGDKTWKAS